MKRTAAAFTIMLGLTALMLGLYFDQFKSVEEMLRSYTILFP